jgi:hypothetical protein
MAIGDQLVWGLIRVWVLDLCCDDGDSDGFAWGWWCLDGRWGAFQSVLIGRGGSEVLEFEE